MVATRSNPAPRAEGGTPDDSRVSWFDIATAADNERGRHVIWRDELRRQLAADGLSERERDTLRGAIRSRVREVAVFEAIARLIERVRSDGAILARLRAIDAAERLSADADEGQLGIEP